ncbi:UPF0415 protein C7orf25 homolog [Patiria miniata]|uniref:CG025 protein n=1 Tax=Patiria miniata TaxID=46514 RepID=A0A914AD55_PATMI|nr:UPF0415 protein C7orf25 homolog [Patiria miniata]XP_038061758.1 UPF0415 protein C7orf25 homolog [Patiria miniata]
MANNMDESTRDALQGLLGRAEDLLGRAQMLQSKESGIAGIGKLIKKIQSERTFVKSLQNGSIALKENQLKSTNLTHLEGVLHSAESFGHVLSVLHPFHYEGENGAESTVIVDVVANGGTSWVKVTARKAKALHRIWEGDGEYGEHDIVEQAEQFLQASRQHPINYQPPTVNIVFYGGVTKAIVDDLVELGIKPLGHIFQTVEDSLKIPLQLPVIKDLGKSPCASQPSDEDCRKVNLDVTTMVALVSDLTHGGCWHAFAEPLIQELAEQERQRPLVAEIEQFLQDKELYACQTAITDFQGILGTIAGPTEWDRSQRLLSRITVVEDGPSDRAKMLEESHRVKHRAKVIFGTGDKLKAITTTANIGFVRAARNKGVSFAVHIHQSRALTEKKRNSPLKVDASLHSRTSPQDAHCKVSDETTLSGSIQAGQENLGNDKCTSFPTAAIPKLQKCPESILA